MIKQRWEIWTYHFPDKGPHPVVLISHPDRCERAKILNVLYCTTQRQSRQVYENEVLLNSADGLDWETFCQCDLMYAVKSDELIARRGNVSPERRQQIRQKLIAFFRLFAND